MNSRVQTGSGCKKLFFLIKETEIKFLKQIKESFLPTGKMFIEKPNNCLSFLK